MNPGIYPDMTRAQYDTVARRHWSTMKEALKSPAHFRWAEQNGRKDTAALAGGRVVHTAILELEKLHREVIVWEGGRRAGKAWDAFEAEHKSVEIVKPEEMDGYLAISKAVRNHPVAGRLLLGGRSEVAVLWDAHGHQCKGRLDYVVRKKWLVDVKTTRDASVDGFAAEAWRLNYLGQAAFYSDGYEAATGERPPYYLVAVEKTAPYAVTVFRVPESLLEIGRGQYLEALQTIAACEKADEWPGYPEVEHELAAPRWARPPEDDSLEDMGLIIGGVANG